MSTTSLHSLTQPEPTDKEIIKNYLSSIKAARLKKSQLNQSMATSISRSEALAHLERVHNLQKLSTHNIRSLAEYRKEIADGLDPFQVNDFICQKELEEIEIALAKGRTSSRKNVDRKSPYARLTNTNKSYIDSIELKSNQIMDLKKTIDHPSRLLQEKAQMYTFSHKSGRQPIRSKNLGFLNQSVADKLENKSASPSKFLGRSIDNSSLNLEDKSGSPIINQNDFKRHPARKHNISSQNESLRVDSQIQHASEVSIRSIVLKSNGVPKAFENDALDREDEDIINYRVETEGGGESPATAEIKMKSERQKIKAAIIPNHSETLRIKLEEVVVKNRNRNRKPPQTLQSQIYAKLKKNKEAYSANRSHSVLSNKSKSQQDSSSPQTKTFVTETSSSASPLKARKTPDQFPGPSVEEKTNSSPCHPKLTESPQEPVKFSEKQMKAYGLFSKNLSTEPTLSSTGIHRLTEVTEPYSGDGKRGILKKQSLLNREEASIGSQGEIKEAGKSVRYQELPHINSIQSTSANRASVQFFREKNFSCQLPSKPQEVQESKLLLKRPADKRESLLLIQSLKEKNKDLHAMAYGKQNVRYSTLEDDIQKATDRLGNSVNIDSLKSFKSKSKIIASLVEEKRKCQSIMNRSIDLSDGIHEIGEEVDRVILDETQRKKMVGELLDVLQKASTADSASLQTAYHYNKATILEYRQEEARIIKEYSDKRKKEFVKKELEEARAMKTRVRKALNRTGKM